MQNSLKSPLSSANKSPQSKQAASQNAPQGEPTRGGQRAMLHRGPTRTNGRLGKGFGGGR